MEERHMNDLFFILFLVSLLALPIGLVKPSLVLKWLPAGKRNRKSVAMYFGLSTVLFFILFGVTVPSTDESVANNTEIEEQSTKNEPAPDATEEEPVKEEIKEEIVKEEVIEEAVEEEDTTEAITLEEQINAIAISDSSTTEKHDEVARLVKDYTVNEVDLKQFEKDIIAEFTSGKYLNDITNDTYMLTNLFKSMVIESNYEDSESIPIDKFSFDFLQNTKYTYRGVDAVDSTAVKSNEEQMQKSLAEM